MIFLAADYSPDDRGAYNEHLNLYERDACYMIIHKIKEMLKPCEYTVVPLSAPSERVTFINNLLPQKTTPVVVIISLREYDDNKSGLKVIYSRTVSDRYRRFAMYIKDALCEFIPLKDNGVVVKKDSYLRRSICSSVIAIPLIFNNNDDATYLSYPNSIDFIATALKKGAQKYICWENKPFVPVDPIIPPNTGVFHQRD